MCIIRELVIFFRTYKIWQEVENEWKQHPLFGSPHWICPTPRKLSMYICLDSFSEHIKMIIPSWWYISSQDNLKLHGLISIESCTLSTLFWMGGGGLKTFTKNLKTKNFHSKNKTSYLVPVNQGDIIIKAR